MVILNQSSKSYISSSLWSLSRDLSCVLWNIVACFFIFLDSLCWYLCIRQSRQLSILNGLTSYSRWSLPVNPTRDSNGISKLYASPTCLLCSLQPPSIWVMLDPFRASELVIPKPFLRPPLKKLDYLMLHLFPSLGRELGFFNPLALCWAGGGAALAQTLVSILINSLVSKLCQYHHCSVEGKTDPPPPPLLCTLGSPQKSWGVEVVN